MSTGWRYRTDSTCPCQGCEDRTPACQDKCQKEKYIKYKARKQADAEGRKNERKRYFYTNKQKGQL